MEPIQIFLIILGLACFLWVLWKIFGGPRRDPQRSFNKEQEREILEKQNYTCAVCPNTEWQIFVFHHKSNWADNGRTIVENGCALCPNCHRKHHKDYSEE